MKLSVVTEKLFSVCILVVETSHRYYTEIQSIEKQEREEELRQSGFAQLFIIWGI